MQLDYDGDGNLARDAFHTYTWDADGNRVTIDTYSFNVQLSLRHTTMGRQEI
jgi:hypothetical protein